MSTKTTFKRIALVAVAALGLGVLSVAPSQATVFGETLTIDSATDTATVGDTATAVLTHIMSSTTGATAPESSTIAYTCTSPSSTSCITLDYYQTASADTANVQDKPDYAGAGTWITSNTTWQDTANSTTGTMRSVINVRARAFTTAGTYVYTFYTKDKNMGLSALVPFTWTITVSAATSTTGSALGNLYVSDTTDLGYTAETNRKNFRAGSDSEIVTTAGTAATPVAVAYAFATVKNSAGDTATATSTAAANTANATAVKDTLTVTVSGPGLLTVEGITSGTVKAKAKSLPAYNGSTLKTGSNSTLTGESLTVWSDGTAGVSTITLSNSAGVVIGSFTVTFTGVPASITSAWLADTSVALTGQQETVIAIVKDSAGTVLKSSGTVYLYSSDTSVAGDVPVGFPNPKTTTHACAVGSDSRVNCPVTLTDTGTVTLTLRDSWTVAASTWSSPSLTLTVTGVVLRTATVAFDKATYAPGERAVITITGTDSANRNLANKAITAFTATLATPSLTDVTGGAAPGGTYNRTYSSTTFQGLLDSGIETRVVTMPTFATGVTYALTYATFGSVSGATTTVSASATVVDPNAAAVAAAKDASDAATDAALEATDAAYAATDAANIAAEAADAATAAAEAATEAANAAKESADAATAAVEELATSVAKLMAALQAQITTLAKVVAKIAVKVKA